MKYLFFGISWIFRKVLGVIIWALAQSFIFIWNFNLKHNEGYTAFWKDSDINNNPDQDSLLRWSIIFLVVSIISAIFGFGGIDPDSAHLSKVIFYIFLVLFVLTLISGGLRKID